MPQKNLFAFFKPSPKPKTKPLTQEQKDRIAKSKADAAKRKKRKSLQNGKVSGLEFFTQPGVLKSFPKVGKEKPTKPLNQKKKKRVFGSQKMERKKPVYGSQKIQSKNPHISSRNLVTPNTSKNVKDEKMDVEEEPNPFDDSSSDEALKIKKPTRRKRKIRDESEDEYVPTLNDKQALEDEKEDRKTFLEDDVAPFQPPPEKKRKLTHNLSSVVKPKPILKKASQSMQIDPSDPIKEYESGGRLGEVVVLQRPRNIEPGSGSKGLMKKNNTSRKGRRKSTTASKTKKDPRGEDWYENPKDHRGKLHTDPSADKSQIRIPKARMKRFTPGMKDYWQIKENSWDGVIFYKCGKFYEIYLKDAEICHELLHLSFMNDDIPHVGFPEKSVEMYAQALVEHGYKIYRVEEMESAEAAAKRANKKTATKNRELCQVYTPGTHLNAQDTSDRYLFSIWEELNDDGTPSYGLAWVEAGSGKFTLSYFKDDRCRSGVRGILENLQPQEILYAQNKIGKETLELLGKDAPNAIITDVPEFWSKDKLLEILVSPRYFEENQSPEISKFGIVEQFKDNTSVMRALAGIIAYLQKSLLDKSMLVQKKFASYDPSDYSNAKFLTLDKMSIENLHIFADEDGKTQGSLFRLINNTSTPFGARLLRTWITQPLAQRKDIEERLDAVQNLVDEPGLLEELQEKLKELPDLGRLKTRLCGYSTKRKIDTAFFYDRAVLGKAKVDAFVHFMAGMKKSVKIIEWLFQQNIQCVTAERLKQILTPGKFLPNYKAIIDDITEKYDEKLAEDGILKPQKGRNPKWERLNKEKQDIEEQADEVLKKVQNFYKSVVKGNMEKTGPKWATRTAKHPGFHILVKKNYYNKKGMPVNFSQAEGANFRIENDALIELSYRWVQLSKKMEEFEYGYLLELFGSVAHYTQEFDKVIQCFGELDCILSLATVSKGEMSRPIFVSGKPTLELIESRHPCIDLTTNITGSKIFIPNDIILGGGKPSFMCLTGPNMGGKSTILRQVCITVLMAQIGCFVPATKATLSVVDRIFTRIGANDNILSGQSTFMIELEETSNILRHATNKSLVILDELGRGTSTYDGAAIAFSVAEHLISEIKGCRVLFSTHYHMIAQELDRKKDTVAMNHMGFRVNSDQRTITFLYKLTNGLCLNSHGINCAKLAGVDKSIMDVAEYLSEEFKTIEDEKNLEKMFDEVLDAVMQRH